LVEYSLVAFGWMFLAEPIHLAGLAGFFEG
jgi:hypothetical protein